MISWDLIDASEPHHSFIYDPQLAPGEAKELTPNKVDLAHLAPEGSRQLAFPGGVNVRVTWLLLTDNASRRWIIRPLGGRHTGSSGGGGRTRRVCRASGSQAVRTVTSG
jgi:hypothetical protein